MIAIINLACIPPTTEEMVCGLVLVGLLLLFTLVLIFLGGSYR